MPYVFLDFEASSLSKLSYPIEVGWVHEDGTGEAHLIRPAPGWTEWDDRAEIVHHISRSMLDTQGEPHEEVCARVLTLFETATVLASAPSWDGHWLSMLLRASGLPRHLRRLQDTQVAFLAAATARTANAAEAARLVDAVRAEMETQPADHRAEADARRQWAIWRAVQERR